ncbi:hypothetical protein MK647_000924 [Escherichia coli]|nr:hypothetical protein [Escherichia coli]
MGEISVKTGNNARNGGKNSLNRLIRCVCGKKIGPDPRNFNQRVSLGRNDLLIRTFLCDRFGIGVDEKKYFTPYRIIGALFAVIATIFVVSPQWHSTSFILLAILPFLAGLLAGWQPAGNAKVAEATGSMLVSIT